MSKTVAEALVAVEEAEEEYTRLRAEYDAASKARTASLNRLNHAQGEFDKAVTARREGTASESDWSRRESGDA